MNQCIRTAESMFNMPFAPPLIMPLKRQSIVDIDDHISKKQAVVSHGDLSPYAIPRGFGGQAAGVPQPVNIQPRPNGYVPLPPKPRKSVASPTVAPTGRRRGRPSKAESLARQTASQIMPYQPITPAPITPSHGPTGTPQPHSPGYGVYSGHQISSASLSDPKPNKSGGRQGGATDKRPPPLENIPRTVQGGPGSAEVAHGQGMTGSGPPPEAGYRDWRVNHRGDHQQRQPQPQTQLQSQPQIQQQFQASSGSGPGSAPLEPPLLTTPTSFGNNTILPPPRSPHTPLGAPPGTPSISGAPVINNPQSQPHSPESKTSNPPTTITNSSYETHTPAGNSGLDQRQQQPQPQQLAPKPQETRPHHFLSTTTSTTSAAPATVNTT